MAAMRAGMAPSDSDTARRGYKRVLSAEAERFLELHSLNFPVRSPVQPCSTDRLEEPPMLIRTRPYRPLVLDRSFDRSFDRPFEQLTSSFFSTVKRTPVVDAAWRDGDLVLSVDLPGVPVDQVGVSVSGRTLTLSAKTEHSSWERSMSLGAALDPEQVSASYVDGRLTVTVGATAQPEARTIEISTTAPAAEIEAGEPGDVGQTADAVEATGTEPAQP